MKKILLILIIALLISYPFQYVGAVTAQYCFDGANTWASYWLEDELDNTANNYDLTNNGSVTFPAGLFDNGGSLGTSNSTKWLENSTSLGWAGGDVSIYFRIKILTDSGTQELIQIEDPTTTKTAITMRYNGGSDWTVYRYRINVGIVSVPESIALGTTNFYNFVITYNASTDDLKVYRDTVLIGTANNGLDGNTTTDPAHFSIGKGTGPDISSANYSSAIYDEVVVENTVWDQTKIDAVNDRSDAAILTNCAGGGGGGGSIISPLILFE